MRLNQLTAVVVAIAAISTSYVQPAQAQNAQDQFEIAFQARETSRRAKISGAMRFDETQAEKFWPLYDQYRLVAKGHQRERYKLIQRLAKNVVDIKENTADDLVASALALDAAQQSAKKKYPVSYTHLTLPTKA